MMYVWREGCCRCASNVVVLIYLDILSIYACGRLIYMYCISTRSHACCVIDRIAIVNNFIDWFLERISSADPSVGRSMVVWMNSISVRSGLAALL